MLEHLVLITACWESLSMPMTYLYPALLCCALLCYAVIRTAVAYRTTVSAGGVALGVSPCVFGAVGLLPLFRCVVVQNLACMCSPRSRLSLS